ncbi:DUF2125 domain-containing protein [Paracoccus saliphilus]|uniref:DUF2125 domain-containing protein n=1 Tax=Paracoccus saliphilus TaxID=405559 RepID=A0AA45W1F7_9RHOB|nr:DUF2125 domain-containing protein [Paracoccus saliphilus]WCR03584.1 DUF2125 domain-containing protein [Paracoccus saliphilus]SIS56166.1 hypothetical protein SAMN05421772_101491 [Paracoccus saliphilus]
MRRTLASSAIALIVGAGPVLADLTPAQVWENLESYYTDMGYQVTIGSTDDAGSTLTLSDVVATSETEQVDTTITIPTLTLEQTGDAKVRSVMDGELTIESLTQVPDEEPMEFNVVLVAPDNEMLSSGTVEDMLHEFNYPSLETVVRLGDENANGGEVPFTATLTDLTGQYRTVQGDDQNITYDMTAAGMDLELNVNEPPSEGESQGQGKFAGQMHIDGITTSGQTVLPAGVENMAERIDLALNAGFLADGTLEMGEMTGNATFEGTDADGGSQSGSGKFTSGGGDLTFAMSKDGMSYEGTSQGTEVEVTVDQLPFPIAYAVESAAGALTFPISKSEDAQPFSLNYELVGLTLADGIWNLFDPGQELPRDPANLKIDVAGEALMKGDLFDPAFGEEMAGMAEESSDQDPTADGADQGATADGADMPASPEMPFEPQSVKINAVTLQAVGVDANVTGDLTIPQGAQQPVGIVEGEFTGVNALLEKLVSIGLVPQEQLMGARMMIAMFAKPVEGNPDQMQTKLEFKEDGSIFANGQQVQ